MASGAATSAAHPTATATRPLTCDERERRRRPRPRDRGMSSRPPSGADPGSEDSFVDDQDVTWLDHHVLRAPLCDVCDGEDVRLDLAGDLAAKVDRVLRGDP